MNKPLDESDLLKAGELDADPEADAAPFEHASGTRLSALRLVGVQDAADLPDPSDAHAESALLGTLLWCGANAPSMVNITTVRDLVENGEMFYVRAHGAVFDAIDTVSATGAPTDVVAVHAALVAKRTDRIVGGMDGLEKLVDASETASAAKARAWAASIRDAFARRQHIAAARAIEHAARTKPANVVAQEAVEHLSKAAATVGGDAEVKSIGTALRTVLTNALMPRPGLYWETGLADLDAIIGGMFPFETSILAASTSIGKTILATQVAKHVGRPEGDGGVLYVTNEMTAEAFAQRMLSAEANVDSERLRRGKLWPAEQERLPLAANELSRRRIQFADARGMTMQAIDARATTVRETWARKSVRLALIVVDVLGNVKATAAAQKKGKTAEVSEVSGGLARLAKNHSCHVMALHHINREGAKRPGKQRLPRLFDLRDSGKVEDDADVVLLLHRDREDSGLFVKGTPGACVVAKQRNGPLGMALLDFESRPAQVSDWKGRTEGWFQ